MPHSTGRIALSGEYLAASFLLKYCDSVIMAPPGHRSDLILDHQGQLYRVQVKTTNKTYSRRNKDFYRWELRAGQKTSNNTRQNKMVRYGNGQIDFFCLVALPINKIIFAPLDGNKNLTEYSKNIGSLNKIDSKESLLETLLYVNKNLKLKSLNGITKNNI
tara:strand:+ start:324 stop:806 length:483 start_codon:yes stop_codon:yes gene_type:complete